MMNNLNQIKKMADEVKGSMEKLVHMTDDALKNLSDEERKQIAPIQRDIYSILNAVKEGDTMKIHEISRKYAGSNSQ